MIPRRAGELLAAVGPGGAGGEVVAGPRGAAARGAQHRRLPAAALQGRPLEDPHPGRLVAGQQKGTPRLFAGTFRLVPIDQTSKNTNLG